jgi:hypothetical protein
MPKFLAGCHYNEENLAGTWGKKKKKKRYWPVQINRNKFATGQFLKTPVEVARGGHSMSN